MSLSSLPLFEPQSDWTAPAVSSLPAWPEHGRVSVDLETRDPDLTRLGPGVRRGARIVGVSFAIEDGPSTYLPVAHELGGNLDPVHVFDYLRYQARIFRGDLCGANLGYDLDFLLETGVDFRPRRFRDCLVAEPLLDENQVSYSLQAVASRHGIPGKAEVALRAAAAAFGVDPKADLWRLHARHVGPYAEQDARLPLQLLRRQERMIEEQDLERVWDLECRVLPLLVAMRRRGVRVDLDHLAVIEARAREEEASAMAEFSRLAGVRVGPEDVNRASVVGPAIEAATGQRLPRTAGSEKRAPQVQMKMNLARDNLAGLEGPVHPAVVAFLRARRWSKTRTTFVESVRAHEVRGRVNCSFTQMKIEREDGEGRGTVSGRLSSTDPNLQQQPNRDPEIGPLWRRTYLPDEGAEWACLDYSGQEPRWVVHFADAIGCQGADDMVREYRRNPAFDPHGALSATLGWSGKQGRGRAKTIYLGVTYGMGGAKLCRSLGLPTAQWTAPDGFVRDVAGDEGRELMRQFDERAPFIRQFARAATARADQVGYVRTPLGRRFRFDLVEERGRIRARGGHKAANRIVQGTAADQTKSAMVAAEEAGILLQLQVHDELDLSVSDGATADRLAEIMREALPCSVPHLVEPKVGPSWGEVR